MSLLIPWHEWNAVESPPSCPRCGEVDPETSVVIRHEHGDRGPVWVICRPCQRLHAVAVWTTEGLQGAGYLRGKEWNPDWRRP